jgi:hypothetical protein
MKRAVRYRWSKGAWWPFPAFTEDCDREFTEGEAAWLEPHRDRSMASHGHYFIRLTEAWAQLPEDLQTRFPHPHNLRKWLLIETGWRIEMDPFPMRNSEAALRLAHELSRQYPDDRIFVDPSDTRIVRWQQAKSQSMKAMGNRDFQASKDAVLNKAAEIIGVSREELDRNAGRAA